MPEQVPAPEGARRSSAKQVRPSAAVDPVRLSVIIPCHNAADLLAEQLEALARECWQGSWETIVVDDGSDDDPAATVMRFRERLPSLRLLHILGRRGAASARNLGARVARGELLLFLDADDVIAPGWLLAIEAALREHPVVASRFDTVLLNPPARRASRNLRQERELPRYRWAPFLPHASGCGLAVRREWHEAIGGFDESLQQLEDTDYTWRLQLAGADLVFVPDALVHMRFREGSSAAFRQAFGYGRYSGHLQRRYRSTEAPHLAVGEAIVALLRHLRGIGNLRDPTKRLRWWRRFAKRLGRLTGLLESTRLPPTPWQPHPAPPQRGRQG